MSNEIKKTASYHYFQFPLCLLMNLFINPAKWYDIIIDYAILRNAEKQPSKLTDVCRQLIYDFFRSKKSVDTRLIILLNKYEESGEFSETEDCAFDSDGGFDPLDGIVDLESIFRKDEDFRELSIYHYKLYCAKETLNIQIHNYESLKNNYEIAWKEIQRHEEKFGKDIIVNIKTEMFLDFKNKKDKNENELLCAYIAISSIIGMKNFQSTNKSVITMRMLGAKSNEVLKLFLKEYEN